MRTNRSHWTRHLRALGACQEAVAWARAYPSLQAAWEACDRADWMLWLIGKTAGGPESASRKRLVLVACRCARTALRYVPAGETRPLRAIQTAERWARGVGGVTLEHVRVAANAADAAYYAANAAAADAAAYAANAAAAADAYYAADAAAYAAASSASASAADAAASAKATHVRRLARLVRNSYVNPPRLTRQRRQGT